MNPQRIVLAGATHPDGAALRAALEDATLAVGDITLLDPAPAGLLTQFRGEPKLSIPLPREPEDCAGAVEGAAVHEHS